MKKLSANTISSCPFIDNGDNRCAKRLSLGCLDEAFGVCLGNYQTCQIYQQLMQEKSLSQNIQINFDNSYNKEPVLA